MIDRLRWFLLSSLLFTLCACSGGGGSPGNPMPPAPTTGSLAVTISGLPAGGLAAVHVSGPNSFSRDLTQTTSIADLAPGSYTLTATLVAVAGTGYTPSPLSQNATVAAGATASATVTYAAAGLSLAAVEVATAVNPVFLTAPPGDSRQFVVERAGRIRILQNGSFLPTPFLDIGTRVQVAGEGGLLSMAFDPGFATNGRFYMYYVDTSQNIVVERMTVSSNANVADPLSSLVIMSASPTPASRTISAAWSLSDRTATYIWARATAAAPAIRRETRKI